MSTLDSAFENLVGRQMDQKEARFLYKLRDELGMRDNDAFWTILIALQTYQTMYQAMPKQIAAAATAVLEETRAAAQQQTAAVLAESRDKVIQDMAVAARSVAKSAAGRDYAFAVGITIALSMVGTVTFMALGYDFGKKSGQAVAMAELRGQEAWANSLPGVQARMLHDEGYLDDWKRCRLVGYRVENGVCSWDAKQRDGRREWRVFKAPSATGKEKVVAQRAAENAVGISTSPWWGTKRRNR